MAKKAQRRAVALKRLESNPERMATPQGREEHSALSGSIPEVTDLECAFGAAMRLLPAYASLPREYQDYRGPFCDAASSLFFKGGKLSDFGLKPKPGIDERRVYRVLKACLSDFAPSHGHKIGGTGYLLSQWYEAAP